MSRRKQIGVGVEGIEFKDKGKKYQGTKMCMRRSGQGTMPKTGMKMPSLDPDEEEERWTEP